MKAFTFSSALSLVPMLVMLAFAPANAAHAALNVSPSSRYMVVTNAALLASRRPSVGGQLWIIGPHS